MMVVGSADLVFLCFVCFWREDSHRFGSERELFEKVSLDSSLYCVLRVLATEVLVKTREFV